MPETAQVFEHGQLAIGQEGLTEKQFNALVRYNYRHGCKFFNIGYKRLHFGSYVGVIQVGDLAIEILPKADREATGNKKKWRNALLEMLRQSGLLTIEAAPEADLHLRQSPLVDIYLHAFLTEVEQIAHAGLVKRYRMTEGNLHKLKGRIQFAQQLRRNLLHQERMFTVHQAYDRDNTFNRILKFAAEVVRRIAVRSSLISRATASALWFEDVADARITAETFERLTYNRNTEHYRKAIQLARLIIQNYSPDLRGGREHVVAILFDMNALFERYILAQLHRAKVLHAAQGLEIVGQVSKRFWGYKIIRPDMVATFNAGSGPTTVILDTKWKIPSDGQPADDDLKQMFAYNVHFGGHRSVLVYPMADPHQIRADHSYAHSASLPSGHRHACATYYVNLFDNDILRRDCAVGNEIITDAIFENALVDHASGNGCTH